MEPITPLVAKKEEVKEERPPVLEVDDHVLDIYNEDIPSPIQTDTKEASVRNPPRDLD